MGGPGGQNAAAAIVRLAVPYVAGAVIYWVSLQGAQRTFPQTWFYVIGPGPEPPW
jgi:hypothetical protein